MPLERVKQGYKDLSMSFKSNPLSDDLIGLKDETAIARSIRNIVFTIPGEVFFNPNFGSEVSASLFEIVDEISATTIRNQIEYSINEFEPRVNILELEVHPDYNNNEFNAVIVYEVIGADVPPQQLEFVLLPSR